jgi:hypothetical protein
VFQGFQGLSQYQYKTDSPNLSHPQEDALCGNLRPRQLSVSRGVVAGVTAHTMSEPSSSPFSHLKMNAKFDSSRSCGPPRYEGCFWMSNTVHMNNMSVLCIPIRIHVHTTDTYPLALFHTVAFVLLCS